MRSPAVDRIKDDIRELKESMNFNFATGHEGAKKRLRQFMGDNYNFRNIREAFRRGMISRNGGLYVFILNHETVFA